MGVEVGVSLGLSVGVELAVADGLGLIVELGLGGGRVAEGSSKELEAQAAKRVVKKTAERRALKALFNMSALYQPCHSLFLAVQAAVVAQLFRFQVIF